MITPVQDYLDYENPWALGALDYDYSCTVLPAWIMTLLYSTTWTEINHVQDYLDYENPWALGAVDYDTPEQYYLDYDTPV
jgi:hypothetical protein